MEPLAGSIACLLSLFLPCGQALREVWRCENEAEASRGGSVSGKWLGDLRRSSTLEDEYVWK